MIDYELEVGRILEAIEGPNDEFDVAVPINEIFVIATAAALEQHLEFNATFENEYITHDQISIAIAVDTDRRIPRSCIRSSVGTTKGATK